MTLDIDLFWSFRSPYSYLATPRLVQLAERFDLDVHVRVVYPLAVREPDFFAQVNPLWPPYLFRDVHRIAEFLGLEFRWPRPDPVVQVRENGQLRTAPEQPYIYRLCRLGQLAAERGVGLAFIHEVSSLIWSGRIDDWHQGDHLARAAERAGVSLGELDPLSVRKAERLDARIDQNRTDLQAAGHWGVPTCVFRGEPFFGQDRLELLQWRLEQHGLLPRSVSEE